MSKKNGCEYRTDSKGTINTKYVDLLEEDKPISGQKNIPLIEDDNVIIIGAEDIDFLRSQNVKRAILGIPYQETRLSSDGELNSLFCEPIDNLSKVIRSNSNGRF